LPLGQELALRPTPPTRAHLVEKPKFPVEFAHRCIGLSIEFIGPFEPQRINASGVGRDNDRRVVPDAGPDGVVRSVCRVVDRLDAVNGRRIRRITA